MEDRIKSSKVYQDSIIPYVRFVTQKVHDATSFMLYSSKLSRLYTLSSMTTDQLLCMCIIRSAIASDNNFMALSAYVLCESPNLNKCLEPSDFKMWLSPNFSFSQQDLDLLSTSLKQLENGIIINFPEYLNDAFNAVQPSDLPSYLPEKDKGLDEDIINQTNFKKVIKLFSNHFKESLLETIKFSVSISKFSECFLFHLLRPDMMYYLMYFNALHWNKILNSLEALTVLNAVKDILPEEDIFEPHDIANFILSHFDIKKLYVEKMLESQEKLLSSGVIRIPEFAIDIMAKISESAPIPVIKTKKEKCTLPASGADMKSKPSTSKSIKFEEYESRPASRMGFNSKFSSKTKKPEENTYATMPENTVTVTVKETTEIKGRLTPVAPTITVTPLISNFNAAIPPISHQRSSPSVQSNCKHTQSDGIHPFSKAEQHFEREKSKTGHSTTTKGMQTSTSYAGPSPSLAKNVRKQLRGKIDVNNAFPCKDEIPLLSTSVSVLPTEDILQSPQTEMDLALMDSLDETLKDYPSNSPASQQSTSESHNSSPDTMSSVEENAAITYTGLQSQEADAEGNALLPKNYIDKGLDSDCQAHA